MPKTKKLTKRAVVRWVRDQLDAVGHGIAFDVVEAGVRADDDWWYVPVLSTLHGKDVKRDVTVSVFAAVENDLYASRKLTILLVPVVD